MNLNELTDVLTRDGYHRNWYSFDLSMPPSAGFILEKVGNRWIVFYIERGQSRDIANFEYESDACAYFLQTMRAEYGSLLGKTTH